MKKTTAFILILLCTLCLCGCRNDCIEERPPETVPQNEVDDETDDLSDETETTVFPPIPETKETQGYIADTYLGETFEGIEEMSAKYPDAEFYKLTGLPDGFKDSFIEFTSADNYMIYYSDEVNTLAFMPFYSEEKTDEVMQGWLGTSGTYEYLLSNELIGNVRRTELDVQLWTAYECLYDTSIKSDLKLRYYEYTDEESDVTYILSENYDTDGSCRSKQLFVLDGAWSFGLGGQGDGIISHETAFGFSAVKVE